MRLRPARLRALPLAVLVLAACHVEVDGAPCAVPGATGDCPADQACGNDHRCSARALACAPTRCFVGASECLDSAGSGSGTARVRRCVDTDPVCGAWRLEDCARVGLTCRSGPVEARCE